MNSKSSILIADPYRYFDSNGERQFPTPDEVTAQARHGVIVALVLDSNICLRLSNYARNTTNQRDELLLRQFLLSAEYTKVDIVPFFGCIELSSTPHQVELNLEKLKSFANNVYASIHQSESSIVEGRKPREMTGVSNFSESIDALLPFLTASYACYLKISLLLSKSRKRIHALQHLKEYLDWIELHKLHISITTQAALALFGGAPEAQKVLRDDQTRTKCAIAWGAAWDTTLAWLTQNYLANQVIDGAQQHPIFVTDDDAAAFIAGKCRQLGNFFDGDKPFLSMKNVSIDFPHFQHQLEQVHGLCCKIRSIQQDRIINEIGEKDHANKHLKSLQSEISQLEKLLGCNQEVGDQQI